MVLDRMTAGNHIAQQVRPFSRLFTDTEKSRSCPARIQQIQDARRDLGIGPSSNVSATSPRARAPAGNVVTQGPSNEVPGTKLNPKFNTWSAAIAPSAQGHSGRPCQPGQSAGNVHAARKPIKRRRPPCAPRTWRGSNDAAGGADVVRAGAPAACARTQRGFNRFHRHVELDSNQSDCNTWQWAGKCVRAAAPS